MENTDDTPEKNSAEISPSAPPERMPTPAEPPFTQEENEAFRLAQIAAPLLAYRHSKATDNIPITHWIDEALLQAKILYKEALRDVMMRVKTKRDVVEGIKFRNTILREWETPVDYLANIMGWKTRHRTKRLFMEIVSPVFKEYADTIWKEMLKRERSCPAWVIGAFRHKRREKDEKDKEKDARRKRESRAREDKADKRRVNRENKRERDNKKKQNEAALKDWNTQAVNARKRAGGRA